MLKYSKNGFVCQYPDYLINDGDFPSFQPTHPNLENTYLHGQLYNDKFEDRALYSVDRDSGHLCAGLPDGVTCDLLRQGFYTGIPGAKEALTKSSVYENVRYCWNVLFPISYKPDDYTVEVIAVSQRPILWRKWSSVIESMKFNPTNFIFFSIMIKKMKQKLK